MWVNWARFLECPRQQYHFPSGTLGCFQTLLVFSHFLQTLILLRITAAYPQFYLVSLSYQEDSEPDLVEQLRSAGSVDELMRIVYPSYWSMLKCRSKIGSRLPHRDHSSTETRSEEASYAAAFINLDIFTSIQTEWRNTLCMPRQVCLDVGKEFGAATNTFYKPPCVSVYRCGGCCNSEEQVCKNMSTSYISKTVSDCQLASASINLFI
ncbi:Vascular endothelial growth factor C [Labeo rohita]|uniref:Vascular endothelial growth factor C n=1 Tax=Labeo rohita TaxID=84645 RepID=A0ABQ8N2L4_LABRO|nr:Vascular endothelial growth factor C [Labeo rohita]